MALIYISGVSGTGKSTVLKALSRIGFKTYDSDEGDIAAWYDKVTGQPVSLPIRVTKRTDKWYKGHSWKLSKQRVEAIAEEAHGKTVFLCGSTLSDSEVWHLFAKVICLTIDEDSLSHRLIHRTTNAWGKTPVEFNHVLKWRNPWEERNRKLGAIMIDASQPVEAVVQQVIDEV